MDPSGTVDAGTLRKAMRDMSWEPGPITKKIGSIKSMKNVNYIPCPKVKKSVGNVYVIPRVIYCKACLISHRVPIQTAPQCAPGGVHAHRSMGVCLEEMLR